MLRKTILRSSFVALLTVVVLAGPALAQRGSADFTRFVALGDSFNAGVENASLVMSHQLWSPPAVVARQVGIPICGPDPGCIGFQQSLVSEPGITAELELKSIFPSVVIGPKAAQNGTPLNTALQRPYNNLAVPGFRAGHLLAVTGSEQGSGAAQFILRGIGTAVQQADLLDPTFIMLWIGGNDVLGAILAGSPAALTPIADFTAAYNGVLETLTTASPNAGMVVGTIPEPSRIPFATTVPPVIVNPATGQPVLGPDGNPIFLFAETAGTPAQLTPGSLVTLSAISFLQTGYGIPPPLAPMFPQLPNAGQPLPDAVVLTPAELAVIRARADEVNDVIRTAASSRNIPVAELDPLFDRILEGIHWAGVELDASFVTGGIFSLDGFHLTDIGYTLFANEFIRTINEAYETSIPLASITPFFQNNAPLEEFGLIPPRSSFSMTPEALDAIRGFVLDPVPVDPVRRARPIGRSSGM